jgi:hypothetical protein
MSRVNPAEAPAGLPADWEPCCAAFAIGSLPHRDPGKALDLFLGELPEIACWPQLPAASPKENMYAQFAEGLPGLRVTASDVRCDPLAPGFDQQLERMYSDYLAWSADRQALPVQAAISPDYARGLHALLRLPPAALTGRVAVKGQVTGPLSLALAIADQQGKPLLYDDGMREALCLLLRLKALWQERALASLGLPLIILLDEPYMATYGSAFFNYDASLVRAMIASVTEGLSATTGVHCCANTDWSLILGGPARIVSFDAFGYSESLALYPVEVAAHLDLGGMLAWGIVPALPDDLRAATLASLLERFRAGLARLAAKGIDRDLALRRSFITPSCGLRGLSEAEAGRALRLCAAISSTLRGAASHDPMGVET